MDIEVDFERYTGNYMVLWLLACKEYVLWLLACKEYLLWLLACKYDLYLTCDYVIGIDAGSISLFTLFY